VANVQTKRSAAVRGGWTGGVPPPDRFDRKRFEVRGSRFE